MHENTFFSEVVEKQDTLQEILKKLPDIPEGWLRLTHFTNEAVAHENDASDADVW